MDTRDGSGKRIAILADLPDGKKVAVRKDDDGSLGIGVIGTVRDGESIEGRGEVFSVSPPVEGEGPWRRMETLYGGTAPAQAAEAPAGKPAMVNSDGFRSGWDAVFGKRELDPSLN